MAEHQTPGPAVLRIRLGATLRRLREARGITAQQAADAIRGSDSKISRIELGRHSAREIDVADLLALYGVTDRAELAPLLALAAAALAPPWWQPYVDVLPTWMQTYLGLEEAAAAAESYDTHFVPGVLQTPEYAAGLLARTDFGPDQVSRLLAVRAERVARFEAQGRRLTAVIDEAVLWRPVGDDGVLAGQLRHLGDVATRPNVIIRIRRLAAGAPLAPAGFTILRSAEAGLPDVVCTEQLTSASYLDKPAEVARYAAVFDALALSSEPAGQTGAIIDALLADLG